jgi:Spy/CpxP family protein refolding chaperone
MPRWNADLSRGQIRGLIATLSLVLAVTGVSLAQEHPAPKTLSPGQPDDYRQGRGMSLALAAELNHHPGPRHVLDLADALALTEAQRTTAREVRDEMDRRARDLGRRIIDREAELDRLFASGPISEDALRRLTTELGALGGELRFVHLRAHLAVTAILTSEQIGRYDGLRGHREAPPGRHEHRH